MLGWVDIAKTGSKDETTHSTLINRVQHTPPGLPRVNAIAKNTDVDSLFYLGICYNIGIGVRIDPHQALHYFEQTADGGMIEAQYMVAHYHLNDQNPFSDRKSGLHFLQKAAENGHIGALYDLGLIYGAESKYKIAFSYFKRAAEQGDRRAQFKLGIYYMKGHGTHVDLEQSFHYMKLSADQGLSLAEVRVGLCYDQGLGVKKDTQQALDYFHRASKQNNPMGLYNLATYYQEGIIVQKSMTQALRYYRKAAELNFPFALEAIDSIESKLTASQRLSVTKNEIDLTNDFEVI